MDSKQFQDGLTAMTREAFKDGLSVAQVIGLLECQKLFVFNSAQQAAANKPQIIPIGNLNLKNQ